MPIEAASSNNNWRVEQLEPFPMSNNNSNFSHANNTKNNSHQAQAAAMQSALQQLQAAAGSAAAQSAAGQLQPQPQPQPQQQSSNNSGLNTNQINFWDQFQAFKQVSSGGGGGAGSGGLGNSNSNALLGAVGVPRGLGGLNNVPVPAPAPIGVGTGTSTNQQDSFGWDEWNIPDPTPVNASSTTAANNASNNNAANALLQQQQLNLGLGALGTGSTASANAAAISAQQQHLHELKSQQLQQIQELQKQQQQLVLQQQQQELQQHKLKQQLQLKQQQQELLLKQQQQQQQVGQQGDFHNLFNNTQQQQQQQQQQMQMQRQSSNGTNSNTQQQQRSKSSSASQQQQQLSMDHLSALLSNHGNNPRVLQQMLASSGNTNLQDLFSPRPVPENFNNNNQNNNNNNASSSSTPTLNNINSNRTANSINNAPQNNNNDNKLNNQRLFLETKVEPVNRTTTSNTDPALFANEDDLFKMFGIDQTSGDDNGANLSSTSKVSGAPTSMGLTPAPGSSSFGMPEPTAISSVSAAQQHLQQHSSNRQNQRRMDHQSSSTMPTRPISASSQGETSIQPSSSSNADNNNKTNNAFLLPSTMVPPTVLASIFAMGGDYKSKSQSSSSTEKLSKNKRSFSSESSSSSTKGGGSKSGGKNKSSNGSNKSRRTESPQEALLRLINLQGHSSMKVRIRSEDAGYDTTPSPLQLASFGTELVKAVHTSDVDLLGSLLSCGLSANPCNQFRDSILDLVCKRANADIFLCLLDNGADVRVCDGFGRTPLHHCAWASKFCPRTVEALLDRDPFQLLIEDKRGQTPMEYVRAELAGDWIDFLESKKDIYWPKDKQLDAIQRPKDSRPDGSLPDPKQSVSVTLAALISSGQVRPEQVAHLDSTTKKNFTQADQESLLLG